MLSSKHLHDELKWIEAECEELELGPTKALLKASILTVKLLHNVRSNLVTLMKAQEDTHL